MIKNTILMILAAAVVVGCASETPSGAYTRDGTQYGVTEGVFRGRWWNYYERGASYLGGEFYAEAVQDLEKAVQGRSSDTWRARTYGLHFVEYFPNRELGIAYFGQGRLEEAEELLNKSLGEVDTGRAHYYLDLVKREQIAQGSVQDTTTPGVTSSLEAVTLVAEEAVMVEIDAQDDVGVSEVQMNGKALHQRGSAESVVFAEELVLDEGTHEVEVAAKDLADKEVVEKKQVVVDWTGPTIGIFSPIEPTVTERGTVILEGATVDKNLVISVGVGERILAESPGAPRLEFNTELPLAAGENTFVLAAVDKAGNETRSAVKVFQGDPNSFQAKLWLLEQKAPEKLMLASNTVLTMQVLDALLAQVPETANEIRVKSPDPGQPYRASRTLRVSGEVVTQGKVTSLTINGEAFTDLTGAPKESFNRRIPIADNTATAMTVSITATEESGATLSEEVEVALRPVPLNTPESRLPVAVIEFTQSDVRTPMTDRLQLNCERELFNQERFNLVDRSQLQAVLTEQNLAAGELTDPATAVRLGKLVNAYILMTGQVLPRGEKGLELAARIIDTETSELKGILDAFVEDMNDDAAIDRACNSLSEQLADLYPRLWGTILLAKPKGNGAQIIVDWTAEDGVQTGAYVLAVQKEEDFVDEDTGEVLMEGETTILGRAKIKNVSTKTLAEIDELEQEGVTLEKGMLAITM